MIPEPHITDHALLRWMERVHGIDVQTWRALMQADLRTALDAYDGNRTPGRAAFIVSPTGESVITVIGPDQEPSRIHRRTVAVPRATA